MYAIWDKRLATSSEKPLPIASFFMMMLPSPVKYLFDNILSYLQTVLTDALQKTGGFRTAPRINCEKAMMIIQYILNFFVIRLQK